MARHGKNVIFSKKKHRSDRNGGKKVESQRELMFFVSVLCDDFVFLLPLLSTSKREGNKHKHTTGKESLINL